MSARHCLDIANRQPSNYRLTAQTYELMTNLRNLWNSLLRRDVGVDSSTTGITRALPMKLQIAGTDVI